MLYSPLYVQGSRNLLVSYIPPCFPIRYTHKLYTDKRVKFGVRAYSISYGELLGLRTSTGPNSNMDSNKQPSDHRHWLLIHRVTPHPSRASFFSHCTSIVWQVCSLTNPCEDAFLQLLCCRQGAAKFWWWCGLQKCDFWGSYLVIHTRSICSRATYFYSVWLGMSVWLHKMFYSLNYSLILSDKDKEETDLGWLSSTINPGIISASDQAVRQLITQPWYEDRYWEIHLKF